MDDKRRSQQVMFKREIKPLPLALAAVMLASMVPTKALANGGNKPFSKLGGGSEIR